jgi:hypothetical protein
MCNCMHLTRYPHVQMALHQHARGCVLTRMWPCIDMHVNLEKLFTFPARRNMDKNRQNRDNDDRLLRNDEDFHIPRYRTDFIARLPTTFQPTKNLE